MDIPSIQCPGRFDVGKESSIKSTKNLQRMFSRLTASKPQPEQDTDSISFRRGCSDDSLILEVPSVNNKGCLKIKTQQESLHHNVSSKSLQSCSECFDKDNQPKSPTVQFSHVHIRVHNNILSDNPSVTSGPPIGLGWEIHEEVTNCVAAIDRPATVAEELMLPQWDRERFLILQGLSRAELRQAERDAKLIQDSRRRNAQSYSSWMPLVGRYLDTAKSPAKKGKIIVTQSKQHERNRRNTQVVRAL